MSDNNNLMYLSDYLNEKDINILKDAGKELGISFSNNIGLDALKDKFKEHFDKLDKDSGTKKDKEEVTTISVGQYLRDKYLKLIRVKIHCNDPRKTGLFGEIFATGNTLLGTIKKYIPFDSDEPYHIPYGLYVMLNEKRYPYFNSNEDIKRKSSSGTKGVMLPKTKWKKSFTFEVLPPLTKDELKSLAQAQLARGTATIDEDDDE